jgi:ABC-type multidrug transport system fused ATPase/permease subunit
LSRRLFAAEEQALENIRYGNLGATDQEVIAAAKKALVEGEFISLRSLPPTLPQNAE